MSNSYGRLIQAVEADNARLKAGEMPEFIEIFSTDTAGRQAAARAEISTIELLLERPKRWDGETIVTVNSLSAAGSHTALLLGLP